MKQLESIEQQKLITWWHLAHHHYGVPEQLLFAVPNGGMRSIKTAARLKTEGVRAGVPDLMLACPKNGKNGLFMEMKQGKGRLSLNQKAMLALLEAQGYATAVPYGFEQAKIAIEKYLGGTNETGTGSSSCTGSATGTTRQAADEEGV